MGDHMSDGDNDYEDNLTVSGVPQKYKTAGSIANTALDFIMQWAKPGFKVSDVCVFGDTIITQKCDAVYKSGKIEKGLAFPTCVSVNDCVCHFSPLLSEADNVVLQVGDVVKVDLGVHIDGYISVLAHTFVLKDSDAPAEVTGKAADVIKAAYLAAEACVNTIKPGATNAEVTQIVKQVAEDFKVNPVQGVLMHQLKRYIIDGNNVAINREELDQKVEAFEYEESNVYTVDVVMSTGEGKPIQRNARTTVFKRSVDQTYMLKMKASRYLFGEINKKCPTMPFCLRQFDEKQARMGIVECMKHELVTEYPVLYEKQGDIVAHFKYTVLVQPNGTVKATGCSVNVDDFKSDKAVSAAVEAVLARNKKMETD